MILTKKSKQKKKRRKSSKKVKEYAKPPAKQVHTIVDPLPNDPPPPPSTPYPYCPPGILYQVCPQYASESSSIYFEKIVRVHMKKGVAADLKRNFQFISSRLDKTG